ncbi:conjugative transposon protein TraM [Muricauda oceani]|uniref:Conjugative transposon protein TraM n=1 Tax=Flagellimonas oceani TaxID=2698672 RepID=A0A6G7IZ29_9FLAO|nr:conjugative transposon protein TraM [Allomuricauda oceani]MBW8244828.1 conjugative transposon protein TraM [Allomuricauda oceani]QII43861.1 conjugative transposon protein TraM [Allomuricauda oceani]
MKIEKNKIVFSAVLLCTLLFLIGYSVMVLGDDDVPAMDANQIPVPELEGGQKEYETKLEALDDIKKEREVTAPSIYPDHMVDEKGYFNPDYMEYEKQRIIDSIYQMGQLRYEDQRYQHIGNRAQRPEPSLEREKDTLNEIDKKDREVAAKELELEHQLFFASYPIKNATLESGNTDAFIYVRVDGTQTVRKDYRLKMRLTKDAIIYGKFYPRNTQLYGFVSFKPHRTMVEISNIGHIPVKLTAHDMQDGEEGIYIVNTFRSEVAHEVIGDMVGDVNVPGMPDISGITNTGAKGIKKIFQKNHRSVKVTILDNYRLILKLPKSTPAQVFGKPIDIEKVLKENL